LPGAGVIPREIPAHNGEALSGGFGDNRTHGRWVMPWEVLCLLGGMTP
jgi:hypothetical protein